MPGGQTTLIVKASADAIARAISSGDVKGWVPVDVMISARALLAPASVEEMNLIFFGSAAPLADTRVRLCLMACSSRSMEGSQ